MNIFERICLTIGTVFALLYALFFVLRSLDKKKDYAGKEFKLKKKVDKGTTYLIVPYFCWQAGKLAEIKRRYSKVFEDNGRQFQLGAGYEIEPGGVLFPNLSLVCNYKIKILEDRFTFTNTGNINNITLNGNDNNINIYQKNSMEIVAEINRIISCKSMNESDKIFLQLFIYKLQDSKVDKKDANKAIDILTKFLPLASAAINLIKAAFF